MFIRKVLILMVFQIANGLHQKAKNIPFLVVFGFANFASVNEAFSAKQCQIKGSLTSFSFWTRGTIELG